MANYLSDKPGATLRILTQGSWEQKSAWEPKGSFVSPDPITRSVAAELGARNFSLVADFEREGECEDCEFVGEMAFVMEGFEEAVAECPECGSSVRIYTAD